MILRHVNLENVKIINGSVLVPDPFIFSSREDAIYFGDSRKISVNINKGIYPNDKANLIYKKLSATDDKKIWKK